jgi:protein-L-isoaspartate(D-aspartate) O-methyltransferase
MADITLQRKNMVESQVRPSDVTDRRITAAMLDVARETFVPDTVKPLAYMDDSLEVAPSRRIMAPRTFARLLQLASIEVSDNVLDVGAAGGYSAAVLSRLSHKVVALEQDSGLAASAKTALAAAGAQNVTVVSGDLAAGHPPGAAYDVIVIEGQVEVIPQSLIDQLGVGGRLVAIVSDGGAPQAVLLKKSQSGIARRIGFDAAAPRLPGFDKPKSFVF